MQPQLLNDIKEASTGFWILYNYNNPNKEWYDYLRYYDYNDQIVIDTIDQNSSNNITP